MAYEQQSRWGVATDLTEDAGPAISDPYIDNYLTMSILYHVTVNPYT